MKKLFKVRDLRKKNNYRIDDEYLNGYARLCGVFATAVYNSLSRHADFHTQECFPSIQRMAEQHGINRKSVMGGIKALEKWGIIKIIKEKDTITKRQKVNVYILIDKDDWIPKPDSRVPDTDTESRVPHSTEPSPPHGKSRVPVEDSKVTTEIKVTTEKVYNTHPMCLPECGLSHRVEKNDPNALSANREATPYQIAKEFFEDKSELQEKVIEWLKNKGVEENVAKQEIKKFISYWTELNSSGKKQRWQLEKTFEVNRRLTTWLNKTKEFNKIKNNKVAFI